MSSYQYRKSHCGDKTILRPSYLHNGISYTGKTISSYWIGAQMLDGFTLSCHIWDNSYPDILYSQKCTICAIYSFNLAIRFYIENNVCTRETNCFSARERGIFVLIVLKFVRNKHKNNTRVSTETVLHKSTYIILFLTRHNKCINDDKNDDLYTSSPCRARSVFVLLMTSQSIADDVTITRQLWRDHVNNDI